LPDGLAFSDSGVEDWPGRLGRSTEEVLKVKSLPIRAMIEASKAGIPGNGKPFRSRLAKIQWIPKRARRRL